MNKYPLIKLLADAFGGTKKRSGRTGPKPVVEQSHDQAQHAIMQAKLKRARKKAKRAAVANQE